MIAKEYRLVNLLDTLLKRHTGDKIFGRRGCLAPSKKFSF
jgi:hypothetical protein